MREWIPLAGAVVVVALLTAGSTAVRSVSRIRLRHLVERGMRGVRAAELYLERPHRLLGSAASAIALTCVAFGVWAGAHAASGADASVRVIVAALALLALGQVVPRVVGRRYDAPLLPVLLPALRAAMLATAPISAASWLVDRGLRGARPAPTAETAREGIEDLLREGELEGVGEREEIAIISGVVDFAEKRVEQVMTPRDRVFALDATLPPRVAAMRIAESAYSRVPVFHGTLDDVVGMTHAFDVLKVGPEQAPPLRPVAFTTPDAPCNALLARMLSGRRHLAIVRDAAGSTVGVVTLEDLLEALVGDIRDEHDDAVPLALPVAPTTVVVDAPPAADAARPLAAAPRTSGAEPPPAP